MRLEWLADCLRDAGRTVVEIPGWKDRGEDLVAVHGGVYHATVTGPYQSDLSVAHLLRDGHSRLRGPLSQLGLSRSRVWYVVAAGRCNHNGFGEWGNQSYAVEEFNWNGLQGKFEPFQEAEAAIGFAAINKELGLPAARVKGHKETDPGRKSDPVGVDMTAFRVRVDRNLREDDMFTEDDRKRQVRIEQLLEDLKADATVEAGHYDTGRKNGYPISGRYLAERTAKRLQRVEDKLNQVFPETPDGS